MINERIRQARLMSGMTQQQAVSKLAEHGIKLTKAGLSKYERGGSVPPANVLIKLSKIFSVRSNYFLKEPTIHVEWLAYRKNIRLSKKRQESIQSFAFNILEGQIWLQEKLFPNYKPIFLKREEVTTFEGAEKAAQNLRKYWKLWDTPIESVTMTIEDHGGVVIKFMKGDRDFHGLSGWTNEIYPVTVVDGQAPSDRCRLSLAHELGHLMMDCKKVTPEDEEKLAFRFAAAFIVPSSIAFRELGERRRSLSFEELFVLKRKYGLSIQAWIRRAFDLRIITEGHYNTLLIQLSSKGWKRGEPIQYKGEEIPVKLRQMTLRALAEGIITPNKAEELCPNFQEDFEPHPTKKPTLYRSAIDTMRLPIEERGRLLEESALIAEKVYSEKSGLYDFEALDDEDYIDY